MPLLRHVDFGGGVGELITSDPDFVVHVVIPNSLDFVMGCFKSGVGHDNQVCLSSCFDFGNIGSFFVQ